MTLADENISSIVVLELVATENVQVLDESSFPGIVEANSMVLVSFVHKLLPHCARFIPIFGKIAHSMSDTDIKFAQVDVAEHAALCRNIDLPSLPRLELFQGLGNVKHYDGAMREAEIAAYVTRLSSPTITTITANTFQDFKKASDVVVIVYMSGDDKESQEKVISLANTMRGDFLFGITSDEVLAKAEQVTFPSLTVYKTFDDEKIVLESINEISNMDAFVRTASRPLIVEFLPELHEAYFQEGLPLGYIFIDNPSDRTRLSKMMLPLAKKFKGKVLFGTVIRGSKWPFLADYLWFEMVTDWPSFTIREPIWNLRYPFDAKQDLSEVALDKFVEAFVNDKLTPTIKSEPTPDVQKSPVLDVVGLTYDTIVMDEEKDVLLQFCTPWCSACHHARPLYEELALRYSSDESTNKLAAITTINAEENDFPDRDILGYPWLKLYPAKCKHAPVRFPGPMTVQAMEEFIRDHGTNKAMPKFPPRNTAAGTEEL